MQNKLLDMGIKELRDEIAAGRVKSVSAVEAVLKAIDSREASIGAYISIFKERALAKAHEIDAKVAAGEKVGRLAGVPVALKDNICSDFGATTCGSKMLENFHAPYNASAVEKLQAADAIIIGKNNLDEFGMGSSTENSSLKKTFNPWDTSRVPGGSSGGSAAAVAADMCFGSLGSDTGGSIRQPASFCGVVGLKPTYGRVSRYGLVACGSSLDQIGPITRTVTDAALLLGVIAGYDERDSTSVDEQAWPMDDYVGRINEGVDGLKIGIVTKLNKGADKEVRSAIEAALEAYKKMGAEVIEIEMPYFDYSPAAHCVISSAEESSNMAKFDGIHFDRRAAEPEDYMDIYSKSRQEGFGKEVKRRIILGTYVLSSKHYDAYYLKAMKVRNLVRGDFVKAYEKCDCIMMPVSPTTAFKIGEKTDDPLEMYCSDIYTAGANLAGVPGISVPCGFDQGGLPVGLQILGPAFGEAKLLRIARMYESQSQWHKKKATGI